ncbi:MAG: GIY-YIG nuclease family protein [Ottowia sp.]|nr:GIY-YIG nuclease family protein [Ottowia sp.]
MRRGGASRDSFEQNDGVRGVVYILQNDGFKDGYWKIGSSRHSGDRRAEQLNAQAGTAIPACFRCLFERRVEDCGRAERVVHARLRRFRRGRHGVARDGNAWGQEFFEVDLALAMQTIEEVCREEDAKVAERVLRVETERLEALRAVAASVKLGGEVDAHGTGEVVDGPGSRGPVRGSPALHGAWAPGANQQGPSALAIGIGIVVMLAAYGLLSGPGRRATSAVPQGTGGAGRVVASQQRQAAGSTVFRPPAPSVVVSPAPAGEIVERGSADPEGFRPPVLGALQAVPHCTLLVDRKARTGRGRCGCTHRLAAPTGTRRWWSRCRMTACSHRRSSNPMTWWTSHCRQGGSGWLMRAGFSGSARGRCSGPDTRR